MIDKSYITLSTVNFAHFSPLSHFDIENVHNFVYM